MSILNKKSKSFQANRRETMSLEEFLIACKEDRGHYSMASERLLQAIGEPEMVDTSLDPKLSRIFGGRKIKRYPAFKEFYGMEEAVEQIVSYLKHAGQGLEEDKQILYLLGPVGGGKSSLAEKLKALMEKEPIYRLAVKDGDNIIPSPVNDHPFCLFNNEDAEDLEKEYGIPTRYSVKHRMSPWAVKRLEELDGDYSQFVVERVMPNQLEQIGIAKTEPGDENNQDISALVGKVDIRMLEEFPQDDPDCYSYSGSLCKANQGVMEFVEMFKAPIKVLHPLLTATQERNYVGTEAIGAMPFEGIVLAHSNESEWESFRNNKNNEAFLDRVYIVKVPYCLRVDEEVHIYEKLLKNSELCEAPIAPKTLELLAQWSVLTRLKEPENSSVFSKMRIYNGENLKDIDPKAKLIQEYRDAAGQDEGMHGSSTRFAFKIISKVFNTPMEEVSANPVDLFRVLEAQIKREQLPESVEEFYLELIRGYLMPNYINFLGKEIQEAYVDSADEYGQNVFERYFAYADNWIQEKDYRDPETNQMFDREALSIELEKIEKSAKISNPKDFRNEVVNFIMRAKANNQGQMPSWKEYSKFKSVIESHVFAKTEDLLPVISFTGGKSEEDEKKHSNFVKGMKEKGYTDFQIQMLSRWYGQVRRSN